jgi:hypothetical protein
MRCWCARTRTLALAEDGFRLVTGVVLGVFAPAQAQETCIP